MPITNDAEMIAIMSGIASNVIKKVTDDMLFILQEHINDDTYDPLPNAVYYIDSSQKGMPTFQFRKAFEFTDIQKRMNEVVSELFYNWQNMDYDSYTYLHGSPYNGDMREKLADILNTDGSTGFSNKIRKPYWDNFLNEMFDRGGLEKLFDVYIRQEFGKVGVMITKG